MIRRPVKLAGRKQLSRPGGSQQAHHVGGTGTVGAVTPAPPDSILTVEGVTVRFGGVVANNDVHLWCREGAITALLGPNGAGKTTCMNVISGEQRATSGRISFVGEDITNAKTQDRARLGMARTFQNLAIIGELSVLDNVRVGASRFLNYGVVSAVLGLPKVRRSDRLTTDIARQALRTVGLAELADTTASALPYGDLRRLELARALCLAPRMLLLDEPAAGLDSAEGQDLATALRGVRDHWGVSIFIVEHDLDLVRSLADEAFVLDFGIILAGGPTDAVLNDPVVIDAYVGRPTELISTGEELRT